MCLSIVANPSLFMKDGRFWQSDDHPTVLSVLLHTHIYSNIHMGLTVKTKQRKNKKLLNVLLSLHKIHRTSAIQQSSMSIESVLSLACSLFHKCQQGSDTSPRFVTSPQATLIGLRPPHSCLYFDVFGGGGCKQMDEFWNTLNIFFGVIDAKLLYWGPDWERMAVVTLDSWTNKDNR